MYIYIYVYTYMYTYMCMCANLFAQNRFAQHISRQSESMDSLEHVTTVHVIESCRTYE